MGSERPLNALENIFASCNVRFAVLLVLEAEDVGERGLAACDACRLGHLTLAQQDGWMLLTAEGATVVPGREEGVHVDDFGAFLDDLISREDLSAEGPMTLRLIPYRREQGTAVRNDGMMLYANANHAVCDGRCLMQFLTFATASQVESRTWQGLPDWKDLVAAQTWPDERPFLASTNRILTIKELCQESSKADCFRFDIAHDCLRCLQQHLKSEAATLTGLLIAVFMHCLAAEYRGSEARDLGVSVLVDLRGGWT
eukprot:Skav210757  [mRNA]  locus=scaffold1132:40703:41927:- [translate_table: standard]